MWCLLRQTPCRQRAFYCCLNVLSQCLYFQNGKTRKIKLFPNIYFHNINKVGILYALHKNKDKFTTFEYFIILRKVICQDHNICEEKNRNETMEF